MRLSYSLVKLNEQEKKLE